MPLGYGTKTTVARHLENTAKRIGMIYLPTALDLATSAAVVTVAAEPVDAVLTRFLDIGEREAGGGGGGGDRLIREAASSRSSLQNIGRLAVSRVTG